MDASASGAAFALTHPAHFGQVLLLSLPLPKRFRQYDLTDPSYQVYAVVRRLEPGPDRAHVGVMFLGKHPPRGYEKNPAGRYLLSHDPPPATRAERRVHPRHDLYYNLKLRRQGPGGQQERTMAENIGKGGARVLSSLPVVKGEIVIVEEMGGDFQTRAEIETCTSARTRSPA